MKEINEKHEEELQDKEDLCKKYKRDLERERNKNKALERAMKDFEDRLMVGDIPKVNASAVGRESVESSPEARSFKRPKIDNESAAVKVEVEDEPQQGSLQPQVTTTAYTQSARDEANLRIVTKDPLSVRTTVQFRRKP